MHGDNDLEALAMTLDHPRILALEVHRIPDYITKSNAQLNVHEKLKHIAQSIMTLLGERSPREEVLVAALSNGSFVNVVRTCISRYSKTQQVRYIYVGPTETFVAYGAGIRIIYRPWTSENRFP